LRDAIALIGIGCSVAGLLASGLALAMRYGWLP
jgi:hypothetical protein